MLGAIHFMNDLPLHVKKYLSVDYDMLADDTTLYTWGGGGGGSANQKQYADSFDLVSNWCDNNHMVINAIKTKSITIATRQKHQLSPIPLNLVLRGAEIGHENNTNNK